MKKKLSRPGKSTPITRLRELMATLRSPEGCPWDREQDHRSLRFHAVEEVYELIDAIEAGDDTEMLEELGDLLLQVIFHAQLAAERGAFTFDDVATRIADKLVHRHPHVFGDSQARTLEAVWAQWEQIKRAEKQGTRHERPSAFDGVPRHLPALLRAEKLLKKARKAGLEEPPSKVKKSLTKPALGAALYNLAQQAQLAGWSAEDLLRRELQKRERAWRRQEKARQPVNKPANPKS